MGILSELGDIAVAGNPRVCKAAFVRNALTELSCALCTGNARIDAASMDRLLQRPGKVCSGVVMWRWPARKGYPGVYASVALVFYGLSRGCSPDSFCGPL